MESDELNSTVVSVKAEFMAENLSRIEFVILDRIHVPSKITDEFLSVNDNMQTIVSGATDHITAFPLWIPPWFLTYNS